MARKDTQERILDAAKTIFARAGWSGMTTQAIAHAARVNEVTVFRHFGNKNRLFAALVSRFCLAHRNAVYAQTIDPDASLEDVLGGFAASYLASVAGSSDFMRTMLGEMSRHPKEVREVVMELVKPTRLRFLKFLKERQRQGEIPRDINCEAALDVFVGMLFSKMVKPEFSKPSYKMEDYQKLCVRIFLQGLRPHRP